MDLILMQFGDLGPKKSSDNLTGTTGSSLINSADASWDVSSIAANSINGVEFKPDQCIELVSINQGIQQQVTTDVSNSSRTSGRPVITDFTCVKYVDITSPMMYDHCLRAKPLDSGEGTPTIIYVLRNSGDQLNVIMRFELRLALISEIQFQSHPNDMATEQFKLNFTEIAWHHQAQGAGVTNNGFSAAAWSIAKNSPIPAFSK